MDAACVQDTQESRRKRTLGGVLCFPSSSSCFCLFSLTLIFLRGNLYVELKRLNSPANGAVWCALHFFFHLFFQNHSNEVIRELVNHLFLFFTLVFFPNMVPFLQLPLHTHTQKKRVGYTTNTVNWSASQQTYDPLTSFTIQTPPTKQNKTCPSHLIT